MTQVILLVSQVLLACNLVTLAHPQTPQLTEATQLDHLIESGLFREYGESLPKFLTTTDVRKIPFQEETARPGDTGLGVEVAKTDNVVAIDITPCAESKTVLKFRQPYIETGLGLIRCASGYHHQVKVIEQ